ncbi:FliM/FliN family flagellar motor C-terminal domain-containing protein [Pararhodobacter zhoushanensis]|uniref:FliM/FliN family flagellar motor C-terminal domain-containing protein n=1 Tax=Pararhodobacter zhoushanensis TaxID=2479545 RepID=A0ABT3GZG9_9RHOB|nr:FliM/FliN family flagellar motor C-terminal domain-containing protein [Pararhodobacter zhoushanensis]MCW1932939.1 FliM/FliN family flagellar motor C-terminal domain-containing protein [Pararhodobacter zhoushanensis]
MTLLDRDPVLRRKLSPRTPPAEAEPPVVLGPAPTLVRAFGHAVSSGAPLVAEQGAVHRKSASLAELLDGIAPEAFVTLLGPTSAGPALALIDLDGFITLIEAMTIGRLGAKPPGPRRPTTTDAALLSEVIDTTLIALGSDDPLSALRCARPVPDHRLLPILLDEADYDLVALTATLISGTVTRPLRLMLALPRLPEIDPVEAEALGAEAVKDWSNALEEAVLRAPAALRAELGRVTLPLAKVLELGVGSALELPLSNLEEVRLVALDGTPQAIGRLGQTRGMRAIRLTGWPGGMPQHSMIDAAPPVRVGAGLGAGLSPPAKLSLPTDTAEEEPMVFPAMAPMAALSLGEDDE